MGDLTAVEHVQRQIRTNRKPRTALLAEVFGRGECSSTVRPGAHQRHNDINDIIAYVTNVNVKTPVKKGSVFFLMLLHVCSCCCVAISGRSIVGCPPSLGKKKKKSHSGRSRGGVQGPRPLSPPPPLFWLKKEKPAGQVN